MPNSLRTLLLTCLACFMPLHALDVTTGRWRPAEAAELSSAAKTARVAGDALAVRSAEGTLQSIRGTAEHLVHVQGGDTFQALATLRPGDAVRPRDGRLSTVVSVTPGPRTVHNLKVEFAPTYFVDAEVREGGTGLGFLNELRRRELGCPTGVSGQTRPKGPSHNRG